MTQIPPNYFKNRYNLRGKDWIRLLSNDDRAALIRIGLEHAEYGKAGGRARAIKAKRDKKGRFAKDE